MQILWACMWKARIIPMLVNMMERKMKSGILIGGFVGAESMIVDY